MWCGRRAIPPCELVESGNAGAYFAQRPRLGALVHGFRWLVKWPNKHSLNRALIKETAGICKQCFREDKGCDSVNTDRPCGVLSVYENDSSGFGDGHHALRRHASVRSPRMRLRVSGWAAVRFVRPWPWAGSLPRVPELCLRLLRMSQLRIRIQLRPAGELCNPDCQRTRRRSATDSRSRSMGAQHPRCRSLGP
jgi:hypothetical protein